MHHYGQYNSILYGKIKENSLLWPPEAGVRGNMISVYEYAVAVNIK